MNRHTHDLSQYNNHIKIFMTTSCFFLIDPIMKYLAYNLLPLKFKSTKSGNVSGVLDFRLRSTHLIYFYLTTEDSILPKDLFYVTAFDTDLAFIIDRRKPIFNS
jgi:hypothetical protein